MQIDVLTKNNLVEFGIYKIKYYICSISRQPCVEGETKTATFLAFVFIMILGLINEERLSVMDSHSFFIQCLLVSLALDLLAIQTRMSLDP